MNEDWRLLERHYYVAMAVPFAIDVVITLIVALNADIPGLPERNALTGTVLMLGLLHLAARRLFAPIAATLAAGAGIGPAERALTQLPLRSAVSAGLLYAGTMATRILPPLLFDGATLFGRVGPEAMPTWLDAGMTVLVSAGFMFVVVYFVVSDYLERLCARVFAATGANLSLFYGRFGTKLGSALVFAALAPVLLVAKDVVSYDGERLEQALMLDISVSLVGI